MSFLKAKLHISVCKDYIDFYESKRTDRLEGNCGRKKGKKNNSTIVSANGIHTNWSNDDKNRKYIKGLCKFKKNRKEKKTRGERKEYQKVISTVRKHINPDNPKRKKRAVECVGPNDELDTFRRETIRSVQKKIVMNKVKITQGHYGHLRLNNVYHRKLYLGIMLIKRKRSYLKEELEIKKKKRDTRKQTSGCVSVDFNNVVLESKARNKENVHTACSVPNASKNKANGNLVHKKKGKKKRIPVDANEEKCNNENVTNVSPFKMNVKELGRKSSKSSSENDLIAYRNKNREVLHMEEDTRASKKVSEGKLIKNGTKVGTCFTNEWKREHSLEILKETDQRRNANKIDGNENKLNEGGFNEDKNGKKQEMIRRVNLKRHTVVDSEEKHTKKKVHREIVNCVEYVDVCDAERIKKKEKEAQKVELNIIDACSRKKELMAAGKEYPVQTMVEKKTEIKNDRNNKNAEKTEDEIVEIWKNRKKDAKKDNAGVHHPTHMNNEHATDRLCNVPDIGSNNMGLNEKDVFMESVKDRKSKCILKEFVEMQKEKTEAMEKIKKSEKVQIAEEHMDLKDSNKNFDFKKYEGRAVVLAKVYKTNSPTKTNNATNHVTSAEHINGMRGNEIDQKRVAQIEIATHVRKENASPCVKDSHHQTKLKDRELKDRNASEFKQDDIIIDEIKRKAASEIIRLNLDSSFYSSKGAGLHNRGQNICFFNSIIQSIVRIPYICKDLINKLHSLNCEKRKKKVFCFFCLFEQLACNIVSRDNVTVSNVLVPYIRKYVCSGYKIGYQEDVHEYLRYFLSSLEKCSIYSSIYIQKMFTGVTKNVTICIKCNNVSLKYEQYYELSLDISSSNNLEDALKKFLSKETLEGENGYYCEQCKKKTVASRQCVINKIPRILTIQIKRFFMNTHFDIVKSHKAITYPLRLDMRCFLNKYDIRENSLNKNAVALYEKAFLHKNRRNRTEKIDKTEKTDLKSGADPSEYNGANTDNTRKESATCVYRYSADPNKEEMTSELEGEKVAVDSCRNNWYEKLDGCNRGTRNWCPPPVISKLKGGNGNRNVCVLKDIENIFTDMLCEILQKHSKKKLSISDLKTIVIEKKKLLFKSLSKIRHSTVYDDVYLKICRDLSKFYYIYKTNINNDEFMLKTAMFKYRFDDSLIRLTSEAPDADEFDNGISVNSTNEMKSTQYIHGKNGDVNKKDDSNNYFHFELTGLIKHIGSGTDFGHYVALTKSKNSYLECDDRNVTSIKEKDMLSCIKNAYVFVYTSINPHFIDFYNKYIDVFEKNKFDMNLPVFEKNVDFKERITMPKGTFIKSLLY